MTIKTMERDRPDMGHDTLRMGLGGGLSRSGSAFSTVDFRLALHDLADPSQGYPDHAQIEFLPTRLRWSFAAQRLRLERFSLVNIWTVTPLDQYNPRTSWHLDVGAKRRIDPAGYGRTAARFELGGGGALGSSGGTLLMFGMADVEVLAAPGLGVHRFFPLSVGVGPTIGARLRLHQRLALLTTTRTRWLPGQARAWSFESDTVLRWMVGDGFALGAEARWNRTDVEAELRAWWYF